jgi:hypothetical protein
VELLETDPGKVLCYRYDFVLNGFEIGGGSIRLHDPEVQKKVFAVIGIDEAEAQEKFGFLLDALKLRRAPARRHRRRHGPHRHAGRRDRVHPRRHRVPEDAARQLPAHQGPHAGHPRAAARGALEDHRAELKLVPWDEVEARINGVLGFENNRYM